MLRSTTIVALALVLAAPVVAGTTPITASRDGQTFEYVTRAGKAGAVQIDGKFLKGGAPFTLTVNPSGRVNGFVGHTAVSFRVSRAQHQTIANSLKPAEPHLASGATFSAGSE